MISLESGNPKFRKGDFPTDISKWDERLFSEIHKLISNGNLSLFSSNYVRDFEYMFSEYISVKHCCSVVNGTMAIYAALKSCKLSPGQKVIIPGYTYAATLMAVLSCGLEPILIDIDPDSFCLDTGKISCGVWESANAIIPVHIFGCPCNMTHIMSLSKKYNLKVIEDCAQSAGASWLGKKVGSFEIGCHSFMQNKIIKMGEGGAVTTNNKKILDRIKLIRHEAEMWKKFKYSTTELCQIKPIDLIKGIDYPDIGLNLRLSSILALLGIYSLKNVENEIKTRERNAYILNEYINDLKELKPQKCDSAARPVWMSYVCTIDSKNFTRDILLAALATEGIPVGVHFPYPLNKIKIMKDKGINLPVSESLCKNHIAFPVYPSLDEEHMHLIGKTIQEVILHLRKDGNKYKSKAAKILKTADLDSFYSGIYFTIENTSYRNIGSG